VSNTSGDPMQRTDKIARSQGWLGFSDRSQNVQGILRRMYGDPQFKGMSALFVDHTPGKQSGSLRISIRPPGDVSTVAYANDLGTGTLLQVTAASGNEVKIYAVEPHAYTILDRALNQQVSPLESLPLSMSERVHDGTTLYGSVFDQGVSVMADMLLHPASLITSTFFKNKDVALVNQTKFGGRSAWELEGHQVPTATSLGSLGDNWRMWVDTQTGMVLRLEYYSGLKMVGWGELRNLQIDGQGNVPVGSALASPDWSIPNDAQYVRDSVAFAGMARH